MLGRAVREFQPPLQKRAATAMSPSSTPPTQMTIEDRLKPVRQSSQSIGGYTNFTNSNSSMSSYGGQSRLSYQSNKQAQTEKSSNPLKRKSSDRDGLAATLSAGSFQDPLNGGHLPPDNSVMVSRGSTGSARTVSEMSIPSRSTSRSSDLLRRQPVQQPAFELDPDDFDDDSELDLDVEYPQALPPMSSPRKPLLRISPNPSQSAPHDKPSRETISIMSAHPSSTMTWSSSPAAHKGQPFAEVSRRQAEEVEISIPPISISSRTSLDVNPRPAKRRTVPWLQKEAEQRKVQNAEREHQNDVENTSSSELLCFNCRKPGHLLADCTSAPTYTPMAKEKSLPWNTTASAVKAQQKQKKLAKENLVSMEAMRDAIHRAKAISRGEQVPIYLSEEQRSVLELVTMKKKSVFFTGSAGTGKSVLMRAIIAELRRIHVREPDRVAVTASTGLAACNIGGVTLHSFGGIGLGKEEVPELVKKINRNQKAKQRWLRTKILIIDEISMVDGALFDKLERIACTIRKNGRPFGGIQLVITGDFFQLPPVPDYGSRQIKFAFDAATWSTSIDHTIGLTEVFRQRDPVFANMLNEMRLGKISDETVKSFRRLDRPIKHEDALVATELFPTRREVEMANTSKMRALQGQLFVYKATDSGTMTDTGARDKLLSNCMAPSSLELKKGAQVMLIKNMDDNLVNGSIGQVSAFMSEANFEIYHEHPEVAGTATPDEENQSESFREALSKLKATRNKDFTGDTSTLYPLVTFTSTDGTERQLLCQPEDWKVELPNGEIQAQRKQIPLILAWALSIHKAQGQTLERVKVDLRKVFENGQAYVALSRATCQEGLQVSGFDKNKVTAHPRVGEFYDSLYSVNKALKHPKVAPKIPNREKLKEKPKDVEKIESKTGRDQREAFDEDEEEAMAAYG